MRCILFIDFVVVKNQERKGVIFALVSNQDVQVASLRNIYLQQINPK